MVINLNQRLVVILCGVVFGGQLSRMLTTCRQQRIAKASTLLLYYYCYLFQANRIRGIQGPCNQCCRPRCLRKQVRNDILFLLFMGRGSCKSVTGDGSMAVC